MIGTAVPVPDVFCQKDRIVGLANGTRGTVLEAAAPAGRFLEKRVERFEIR